MKTGSILVPGSGKMGGLVWSHNKGGPYIRTRTIPTNPNSARQQAVRVILAELSAAWELLSDAERSAWNAWAENNPLQNPIGNSYVRTGHQAFVGVNARLLDSAQSQIDEPPAASAPAGLASMVIAFVDEDSITVTFAPTLEVDEALYLWMSVPQEGEGNPNFPQSRLVGYSAVAATSPVSMELPIAVTSGFVVNFWGGVIHDEGLVSPARKDRQRRT